MVKRLTMLLTSLFLFVGMVMAQMKVSGVVTSSDDGEPVVGASVKVLGTNTGTITNAEGAFTLQVEQGAMLEFSYIGMLSQKLKATAKMKVVLHPDNKALDEVVVVAYGTAKRQSITGSVTVVDSKKIANRISTSVTSALEGAAPGVQVNNSYGEPGTAPKINIRGVGTLVGDADQPLYVVDGTPFEGSIAELNPNDIENITVLKDASSAALYGNRAANGVVLITTKHAKNSMKPTISVKLNQGVYTRGIPEYDRLGANAWMETAWLAMKNYGMSNSNLTEKEAAQYATQNLIADFVKRNIYNEKDDKLFDEKGKLIGTLNPNYTDLDWQKAIERMGHRQEYNVSGALAGDNFNMYSSAGYLNEKGYTKNSAYERFTARLNSKYNANKWLELGMNLSGTFAKQNFNPDAKGDAFANPFYIARYMAPVYPYYMHKKDGTIMYNKNGQPQYDTNSPYLSNRNICFELEEDKDQKRRSVLDALLYTNITLPYGFVFTANVNANRTNVNLRRYQNALIGDGAPTGRLSEKAYQFTSYTMQELLNWGHNFGKHHVDVLLGHENYSFNSQQHTIMNTTAVVKGLDIMSNYINNSFAVGFDKDYRTESYLSRIRYNFDEKYFADFSLRRDGSSKFHPDHRWGNFYSAGVNWNMKKENFLKDVTWIDALRTRLSYGEVGNDAAVDLYGYQSLYLIEKNGGKGALIRQKLAADNIKWETTQTVDFGIEGRLFNRMNFSLGYFDKRSDNLLFEVRLPLSAGSFFGTDAMQNISRWQNIGVISNRGVEFSVNADVLRCKDFTWNVALDATTLSNKVIKLPDGKPILHGQQNYAEGHSAFEWYTYHFEGVDQLTGNSLYTLDPEKETQAKRNGDLVEINGVKYTTTTSCAKRVWAGTALPSVYGSFGTNVAWKDLSLNMLFTYSFGGKVFDNAYHSLMSTPSASSAAALHKDILNSWKGVPEGMKKDSPNRIDPTGLPVVDFERSNDNNALSDRWLTSGSYLIFKNITLAYNLPKTLIHSFGFESIAVKASVENLLTLTARKGLNPQYSIKGGSDDTYVSARVFNVGVNLNF